MLGAVSDPVVAFVRERAASSADVCGPLWSQSVGCCVQARR